MRKIRIGNVKCVDDFKSGGMVPLNIETGTIAATAADGSGVTATCSIVVEEWLDTKIDVSNYGDTINYSVNEMEFGIKFN